VVVHQVFELEHIALVGGCKEQAGKSAGMVNAGVQLEAVVPTLVVFAKGSHPSGYSVSVGPEDLADRQHGAVGETERGCRREGRLEQPAEHWQQPVALSHKVLVGREPRKTVGVISGHPVVQAPQRLVRLGEAIPDEDGEKFAVMEDWPGSWLPPFGQTVVYPNENIYDMLFL
jgi:hypothetical protein